MFRSQNHSERSQWTVAFSFFFLPPGLRDPISDVLSRLGWTAKSQPMQAQLVGAASERVVSVSTNALGAAGMSDDGQLGLGFCQVLFWPAATYDCRVVVVRIPC